MSTKTAQIGYASLRKAANVNDEVKGILLGEVPDLFDVHGWMIQTGDKGDIIRQLSATIGEPPPSVGKKDTHLVEPLIKTASGDESGKGLYLHRRGGDVTWYVSPTKKNKAIRLVPVVTGSEAAQTLQSYGYTAL